MAPHRKITNCSDAALPTTTGNSSLPLSLLPQNRESFFNLGIVPLARAFCQRKLLSYIELPCSRIHANIRLFRQVAVQEPMLCTSAPASRSGVSYRAHAPHFDIRRLIFIVTPAPFLLCFRRNLAKRLKALRNSSCRPPLNPHFSQGFVAG